MFLIRHFQTVENGKFIGSSDPSIDATKLQSFNAPLCTRIISSPKKRAVESCKIMFPDREIQVLSELTEIDYGVWEGLTWSEIERAWPELARTKLDNWLSVTPPLGESWQDFVSRIEVTLNALPFEHKNLALVAHQGVNAVIHSLLTGSDPLIFKQGFGEIIEI